MFVLTSSYYYHPNVDNNSHRIYYSHLYYFFNWGQKEDAPWMFRKCLLNQRESDCHLIGDIRIFQT